MCPGDTLVKVTVYLGTQLGGKDELGTKGGLVQVAGAWEAGCGGVCIALPRHRQWGTSGVKAGSSWGRHSPASR